MPQTSGYVPKLRYQNGAWIRGGAREHYHLNIVLYPPSTPTLLLYIPVPLYGPVSAPVLRPEGRINSDGVGLDPRDRVQGGRASEQEKHLKGTLHFNINLGSNVSLDPP